MKVEVKTLAAKAAGDVELDDAIFGIADIRADLLQRAVRWQLARRQQGTHKAKERGEINITKKKYGRQKGGGGARHGARSAPIFVGGGKAHGPRVRSHAHELPKKVRALALKHALSSKAGSKSLFVIEDAAMKDAKTKAARDALAKLGLTNALIIDGDAVDANFSLATRNVPHVDVLPAQGLNVYDVLKHDQLVLTKAAVEKIHARLGAGEAA
ncbi:50S ribosomal protein L4 [Hyphobacterium sp. SN044]|jgi:large subunit ribosomal protein L4|uniref:50S ribosomal protein L4 n=1 Tax=Hyphobacterium sp. SN044 TaxID=2912575 RepID=UPI000584CF47|nr:50S ribosomal protein L4 [Hyphobacterium sp. SN044]MCF8879450.1 50S ribosomal protein L4 [Hyphobacterium sp. SN044]